MITWANDTFVLSTFFDQNILGYLGCSTLRRLVQTVLLFYFIFKKLIYFLVEFSAKTLALYQVINISIPYPLDPIDLITLRVILTIQTLNVTESLLGGRHYELKEFYKFCNENRET